MDHIPPRSLTQSTLLLALLFFSGPIQGASTLNFPRLSFETATLTGLAIVNPNDQSADITLTAFNADGGLLPGVNSVGRTIEANSQLAELVSDIFTGSQDPATVGWIQVASATDNLTGFFLVFNDTVPFNIFDGADLPQTGTAIIFPQVRVDGGYTTELNLINPSTGTATLTVQLIPTGSAPISQSLQLPASGGPGWTWPPSLKSVMIRSMPMWR